MANVLKKYSISSELTQKVMDEALAKARELGVTKNAAILDDGGNLKAFSRMDGRGHPSLLAGMPTLARVVAWDGEFPIEVKREVVGAIEVSGASTVQNDVDCAKAALVLVPDAVSTKLSAGRPS